MHRRLLVAGLTAAAVIFTNIVPASASVVGTVNPVNTSYDHPGIVDVGPNGDMQIGWAGTDANGTVNGAMISPSGQMLSGSKFTYAGSATYPGTGVSVTGATSIYAPTLNHPVIAWTDLSARTHVAVIGTYGSPNPRVLCDSSGFPPSVDTPSLTFVEGTELLVTTVDSAGVMHVTGVANNGCDSVDGGIHGGGNTLVPDGTTTITGNTSYVGPTMVDLSSGASINLWLIWAGTNSSHSINMARYTPGNPTLGTKYVESNRSTVTDLGSSSGPHGSLFTYCGLNHSVYGQYFDGTGTQAEQSLGGSCDIYTSGQGYTNGGVDVTYNGYTQHYNDLYPNNGNLDLTLGRL